MNSTAITKFIDYFKSNGEKIITAILIFVIGYILIKLCMKMLKKIFAKSKLDQTFHKFLLSLIKIILYIILTIISLSKLGIDMTSLVAMLSVVGIAVGLAVQNSLANVAGGFIILFTRPFQVGDFVELDAVSGTVMQINIIQTKLNTIDNKAIYIPNGQVSAAKIVNYSAEQNRRLDLIFSVSYKDDILKVKKILAEIIDNHPLALKEPEPIIKVNEHAQSSINLIVKVWVSNENYWDLNYDLLEQVKIAFDENGISIPFNQLDINVKNN